MATQVQQIIEAAYGKSTKNRPGTIATDATELLGVVTRALFRYFGIIARANPLLIGQSASVAYTTGWVRPASAQSILRIERANTTEVVVVPYDDRIAEPTLPAVYRFGGAYFPAGNANDPTSAESLTFYYASFPATPASVTTAIDTRWPEAFNECLIHDTALYLAVKDGRNDELPGLESERDGWEALLIQFCEHETANERKRFDSMNRFAVPSRTPSR
jgi:hypothetical protein